MKNSIYKNYSKKILKSEVFVSAIIVFVLAIGIIGTSYALYMDVDTDTNYQLVNVGDLSIGFENGSNNITLNNMTPTEDEIAIKESDNIFSFYIYNTGTYTADYNIKLETVEGNEVDKEFINYQICKDNANNCEDITTLSDVKDNIVYKDELSPKRENDITNPSVYYFLRIWINNKYSSSTTKNIKLKVVIDAKNANGNLDNKNTLSGSILNNSNIIINNDVPDFNQIETEEKGIYKTNDNYGISYYFRGNSNNNYVKFANMCFRIMRIEGDGSVKLALQDVNGKCENNDWNIGNSSFNDSSVYEDFETKLSSYIDSLKKTVYCNEDTETPTLKCSEDKTKIQYVNGISKNELILAGNILDTPNESNYLSGNYWTITETDEETGYSLSNEGIKTTNKNESLATRPTISLNSDTLISSGNGTVNSPYIVK